MVAPWKDFATDWVSRCMTDNEVDWNLYSQVMRVLLECLNELAMSIVTRFVPGNSPHALPHFPASGIDSSEYVTFLL